jgi:single-strand DNA-binding protein
MIILTATGRLGRDAELRQLASGDSILSFSVGADTGYGAKKTTEWLDCSIFGKRGEALAQHLTKGSSVTVIGEFGKRVYQGKDGKEVTATTVKVMEVALQGGGQERQQSYQAPASKPRTNSKPAFDNDDLADEIPF